MTRRELVAVLRACGYERAGTMDHMTEREIRDLDSAHEKLARIYTRRHVLVALTRAEANGLNYAARLAAAIGTEADRKSWQRAVDKLQSAMRGESGRTPGGSR